jgi:hypothetical protein
MQDRIGARGTILAELGWREPPGEKLGCRVWRDSVKAGDNDYDMRQEVDLCRSMRAVVGWKPL